MGPGINRFISVPVFAILYCYTVIGVSFVIILSYFKAKKTVQYLSKIWAKSIFIIMGKKLTVSGKEYIEKDNRYIILANHSSLFDIVAVLSFYPNVSWFGHERLLKVPLFGRFLKLTDYVPFREPTISNTRQMLGLLIEKANYRSVALFPEGTRSLDGSINPFFRGFIYLFRTREIDILPLTLNGFYELKPKNRSYIDFSPKLEVIIHEPIPRNELLDKTDAEILCRVRGVIESSHRKPSLNTAL